jgi:hypothetical protein
MTALLSARLLAAVRVAIGLALCSLAFAQPPAVDPHSATIPSTTNTVTERVSLTKPEDFPSVWYDHGCPNCGIVLVGEITRKLSRKVARIDKVAFISQTSTSNWYRCGVLTDVCGTKGEFTADFQNKSGSCEGKNSCYLWRFSTDANPATDVIEVTYLPRP